MKRSFDSRISASVLIMLAATYLVASLALGRSATADPPPDLSLKAADAGIGVLQAAGATLEGATFVDIRSTGDYAAYHIPGSISAPDADARELRSHARTGAVIVISRRDEVAQKVVGAARAADPRGKYFFLSSGVRDWYLTFDLPVALFNEQAPPRGYDEAVRDLKKYVATRNPALRDSARTALFALARLNYQPALLGAATTKAKASDGPRKKISGGCGG
jgi:rhodanese-related sulfurtransferase